VNAGTPSPDKVNIGQHTVRSLAKLVTDLEESRTKRVTFLLNSQADQASELNSIATKVENRRAEIVNLSNETERLVADVKELQATTRRKNSIPVKPDPQQATASIDLTVPAKVKVTWAPEPSLAEQSVYLQSDDDNLHFRPLGPLTEAGTNRTAEFDLSLLSDGTSSIQHGNWLLLYTDSDGKLYSVLLT